MKVDSVDIVPDGDRTPNRADDVQDAVPALLLCLNGLCSASPAVLDALDDPVAPGVGAMSATG